MSWDIGSHAGTSTHYLGCRHVFPLNDPSDYAPKDKSKSREQSIIHNYMFASQTIMLIITLFAPFPYWCFGLISLLLGIKVSSLLAKYWAKQESEV